jgi:hypothetical protein
MGVVSKETVSGRLGYNWDDEQQKIADDQTQNVDIGTAILRSFDRTGGPANSGFTRQQKQPISGELVR